MELGEWVGNSDLLAREELSGHRQQLVFKAPVHFQFTRPTFPIMGRDNEPCEVRNDHACALSPAPEQGDCRDDSNQYEQRSVLKAGFLAK